MTIIEIIIILFIHWMADFVCQTDWQAKNKSNSWKALLEHTATYSTIWLWPIWLLNMQPRDEWVRGEIPLFVLITFIVHTATDYFTSRLNKKLWSENKVHLFFVSVGFDQWLHYVQLFITYQILFK